MLSIRAVFRLFYAVSSVIFLACTPRACSEQNETVSSATSPTALSAPSPTPSSTQQLDARRALVFLGDSLTAGYELPSDQAFPARVAARIEQDPSLAPHWRVVNAGVSGDTSRGGLERLDWLFRSQPAFVFVCLGANDGLRGIDVAETERNLNSILARLKEKGVPAALAGMRMPSNYGPEYTKSFAELFPRVAKAAGVPYFPFLVEGVSLESRYTLADGIHPNAAGADLIADRVFPFLRPLLPGSP